MLEKGGSCWEAGPGSDSITNGVRVEDAERRFPTSFGWVCLLSSLTHQREITLQEQNTGESTVKPGNQTMPCIRGCLQSQSWNRIPGEGGGGGEVGN